MGELEEKLSQLGRVVRARPKPLVLTGDVCQARQFSDEMRCTRCAVAYDVNDPDPPTCPVDGRTCPTSGMPGRR